MALTPKQEAFARAYVETGNASEAYRRAYNAGNMKPETVNRCAKQVVDNPKVAARLVEYRQAAAERTLVTVELLTNKLMNLAQKGEDKGTETGYSVARASLMDVAKLNGLVVDKNEHTGKDGGAIQYEQLKADADAFESAITRLAARSGTPTLDGDTKH